MRAHLQFRWMTFTPMAHEPRIVKQISRASPACMPTFIPSCTLIPEIINMKIDLFWVKRNKYMCIVRKPFSLEVTVWEILTLSGLTFHCTTKPITCDHVREWLIMQIGIVH